LAAAHRDLLAFPTRRSSDLGDGLPIFFAELEQEKEPAITHNGEPSPMIHPMPPTGNEESPDHSPTVAQESPKDHPEATHKGELSDRKSTRLNSSHVKISYAV